VAKFVGADRTVGGTVQWSATFAGPGVSELTQDVSQLKNFFDVGEIDGKITPRIKKVAEVLDAMGHAQVIDSLMAFRWKKLISNACMSGMSAAAGCTFGEVLTNDKARACASYLANELMLCAKADGYVVPDFGPFKTEYFLLTDKESYEKSQQNFWSMYQVVLGGKASMLQDLEKGRKTEVSMINGYISETGRKHGIPTPFNDTVVSIVKQIEDGKEKLGQHNLSYFDEKLFIYKMFQPK
jgi:2-dehydropantoate 2-reductase